MTTRKRRNHRLVATAVAAAALLTAPEAFLMITGPDKRAALDRAATLTPEEAPIRAFWKGLTVHYAD